MNLSNVACSLSDQDRIIRFLKIAAAVLIVGLSLAVAASSLISPLLALAFWVGLLFLILLYRLRPSAMEMLFFLLPPTIVLIPAATKVSESRTGLVWIILLLIIWYFKGMRGRWTQKSVCTPYLYFFIGYCCLLFLSFIINPKSAETYASMPQALSLILAYWVVTQAMSEESSPRLLAAIFLGMAASGLGFLIAFSHGSLQVTLTSLKQYSVIRPFVLGYNPNLWGRYVLYGLPLAAGLMLYHYKIRRHGWWLIPSALMLLMIALIIMSRVAWLAGGMGILFVMATHRRARKFIWIGAIGGGLFLLLSNLEFLIRLSSLFRLESGLSGREDIWPMALNVIADHPLFGLGPGMFKERFFFNAPFMTNGLISGISKPTAHNVFLAISTDIGIFAAILALSVFVLYGFRTLALWRRLKNTPYFGILVSINAVLIAGLIRALFDTDIILPHRYFTVNGILIVLLAFQDQLYARVLPSR